MTNIEINRIRISSSGISVKINDVDRYFDVFGTSQLIQHIEEKTLIVKSRLYHPHNDFSTFENNFFFMLNQIIFNANYHKIVHEDKINCPYWVITKIEKKKIDDKQYNKSYFFEVTLKNLKGQDLNDN